METLNNFVNRICQDVGCYFGMTSRRYYHFKKYRSVQKGQMGVFAWINERKRKQTFIVDTYKDLADYQGIKDAEKIISRLNWNDTGLRYSVKNGSNGSDYQKVVRALKIIMSNK